MSTDAIARGLTLAANALLEGMIQRSLAVQRINARLAEAQNGGPPITQAELDEAEALLDEKEKRVLEKLRNA